MEWSLNFSRGAADRECASISQYKRFYRLGFVDIEEGYVEPLSVTSIVIIIIEQGWHDGYPSACR
jgi:hypothetical protein